MVLRRTLLSRAVTALAIAALVLGGLAGACSLATAGVSDILTAPRPPRVDTFTGGAHVTAGAGALQRQQVWLAFAAAAAVGGAAIHSARQATIRTIVAPALRFSPLRI